MNNQIKLKVTDLIGSPLCISTEDGQKVFSKIEYFMKDGKQVTVSFENVTLSGLHPDTRSEEKLNS